MRFSLIYGAMVLFVMAGGGGAGAAELGPRVKVQEISISLEPERHLVTGQSDVIFDHGADRVSLDLAATAQVESVRAAGKEIPFNFARGKLVLDLPEGDSLKVTVYYRAEFNDPVSRSPAASEDPSYGVNAAITAGGTFLGGASHWYPVPAQVPLSRKITITAPAGIEGITNGARVLRETSGKVTKSVWQESRPVGVPSVSAGPYLVEERQVSGVRLYSYLYRSNANLAPRYLEAAAKYLSFYQDLIGPYPFEKFAIVENFFPTGYGFPSFTLLGGAVIRLPFIADTSLPHEIAHSWWGNGIDVDLSQGNWCEGLVTYLADYLLKERRSPAEALEYRKQLLIDYASLVNAENDFPLTSFVSRNDPASRAIGYGKGAMLFHMIRSEIGDDAFFNALRALARDRMYASASWRDIVAAFSRSAGRDLHHWLEPWLSRPGGPRLSLAQVEKKRQGDGWLVTGTVLQPSPPFEVRLPLRLEMESGAIEKVVPVPDQNATRFAVFTSARPKRIHLDPAASIFRIISPTEIPATVNSLKGSTSLLGVITQDCQVQPEIFKAMLASLSQGDARVMVESALDQDQAASHDVVFCGKPQRLSLPSIPPEVETAYESAIAVAGGDTLLFVVLKRPSTERGVVALFQPETVESAKKYAWKITHYGKYGFVIFSAGAIQSKGTGNATGEGGVVDLSD
ncbi:Peptidase M1, membrane alanine aminopeptidase [Citrifermentans bremense]|uniref:Peptidase M1, membrane alanine aminopeptidase n=1 Tax=Citrifermentans bremense TaxID=60035 RepID=A0A6S6M727_9BACT|nr:M1 family aminopeptidase [Citrifermentans bremense]BCG47666.1 Peptidase M1, membrane alanine aminopeptidase [Citrifermentans bremense]